MFITPSCFPVLKEKITVASALHGAVFQYITALTTVEASFSGIHLSEAFPQKRKPKGDSIHSSLVWFRMLRNGKLKDN